MQEVLKNANKLHVHIRNCKNCIFKQCCIIFRKFVILTNSCDVIKSFVHQNDFLVWCQTLSSYKTELFPKL